MYTPHGITAKTHKDIPLLLVADGRQAGGYLVLFYNLCQPGNGRIVGVDALGKGKVACGVLVSSIRDSGIWECAKVLEGSIHLLTCAFKEATTASYEERVSGEHPTWLGLVRCVCGVVGYRVLGVARCCETSRQTVSRGYSRMIINLLDMGVVAESELVLILD